MSTLADRVENVAGTTVTEWCDRHGLIHELTPFASRTTDRIDVARQLHAGIEDLPKTASTFVPRNELDGDIGHGGWLETILLMTGAWPHPDHDVRWVNPNYIHLDALPPLDVDREQHVRRCAALGVLPAKDIAPRFGISKPSLIEWLGHRDIQFKELRRDGQRRVARTLHTAMAWGHTQSAVTEPWPVPAGTVSYWIQRYAREGGFEPPADPSSRVGFTEDQR